MPFCGRFSAEVWEFCGFRLKNALRAAEAVRETDVMVNIFLGYANGDGS